MNTPDITLAVGTTDSVFPLPIITPEIDSPLPIGTTESVLPLSTADLEWTPAAT